MEVVVNRNLQKNGVSKRDRQNFSVLLNTLPGVVYTLDENGRFTFLSDDVSKVLGYLPHELLGHHFSDIMFPEDVEVVSRSKVLPRFDGIVTGAESAPKLFDERRALDRKTCDLRVRLLKNQKKKNEESILFCSVNSSGCYAKNSADKKDKFVGTLGVLFDFGADEETLKSLSCKKQYDPLELYANAVVHIMSNIFTGIHGNLQLMEMVLNGNPEVKANMASIKECVERAALFIKQLAKENDVNCVSLPQFIASSAEEILRNKGICYTLSVAPHINEKYISQECFSYIIRSVLFYLKDVVLENEELVISVDTCKADPKIHLRLDCDYICIRFIFLEKVAGFCADVQNSNRSWAMERMSNLAKSYSLLRKVGGVLNYDTEPDEVVLYLPFS